MDILQKKLATLKSEKIPPINFNNRYDLTTPPSHPRVSFPYSDYTPHAQVLDKSALARRLGLGVEKLGGCVSEYVDVSSSPEGVCQVTAAIYTVSNSHAGSHADQPSHWLKNPPFEAFVDRQYNGTATIIDLTGYLHEQRFISEDLLRYLAEEQRIDFNAVHRLLLRTYHETPAKWDSNFAYLEPDAAKFLGSLPNLVLVALDSPSVDHPNASPIHEKAHGGLWSGRVAIIEGYESNTLPPETKIEGVIQTTLLAIPGVKDAKQAVISFYSFSDRRRAKYA